MKNPTNDPADILSRIRTFTEAVEAVGFGDLTLMQQYQLRLQVVGLKDAAMLLYFAVLEMIGEDDE